MNAPPQVEVLVIEDETPVRESFREFLEDQLYIVHEATNGAEGVAQFNEHHPDVVVLDLRMPEMNGHQVLEQLSAQSPDTPLIVVSGTGNISDTIEALHLGAWDYLLKPVTDLNILEHAIKQALEKARLIKENRDYQKLLEEKVDQRTSELTEKMDQMVRFNKMAIGRERRVIELKRMINGLLRELGREPKFESPEKIEEDSSLIE